MPENRDSATLPEPPGAPVGQVVVPPPPPTNSQGSGLTLTKYAIMVGAGGFLTTIAQPAVLGGIPLKHLLKNTLHITPLGTTQFFFWITLAWYLKPFAGILTDAFPIFGTRRRYYLLLSSLGTGALWLVAGKFGGQYTALMFAIMAANALMVVASTVVGGLMVEAGQEFKASGRITSLRQAVMSLSGLVIGPVSGWLAEQAWGLTAGICAALIFSLAPITYFALTERARPVSATEVLSNAGEQLTKLFTSRTLLIAGALLLLLYISPGFNTLLFYRQQNVLHFTPVFQGTLQSLGGGAGMLAAALYVVLCRRWNLRQLLYLGIAGATCGALLYLHYDSKIAAATTESLNGFGFVLAELAMMDLAIRATPKGCEGLGFALMMSIRNLALQGSDMGGAWMQQHWNLQFASMVLINAGTTALVFIFIPMLPAMLVRGKDAPA